jgi:predicted nucleic acid-binding Zn ribbon protein
MKRIPNPYDYYRDYQPVPKNKIYRWQVRKTKHYNPKGVCLICAKPVSKHENVCYACSEEIRWWVEEEKSYQDTINSIRADWYR